MGWHTDPDSYKNDEARVLRDGISTDRVPGKCLARGENRDIVASKSPLIENGEIVGLVGSFEDVTKETTRQAEIKRLNEALEKRISDWDLLMSVTDVCVVKIDLRDFAIVEYNDAMCNMIGLTREEYEKRYHEAWQRERLILKRVNDKNGRLLSFYGYGQNITEQRQSEEKFNRAYARIENPNSYGSFHLNLTKNWCGDGSAGKSGIKTVLDLQKSGTVDGYFKAFAGVISDDAVQVDFFERFDRRKLLEGFERGTERVTIEYPVIYENGKKHWREGFLDMQVPGREIRHKIDDEQFQSILERNREAHGGLIREILCWVDGTPRADFWRGSPQPNCAVNILECVDGKFKILEAGRVYYDSPTARILN